MKKILILASILVILAGIIIFYFFKPTKEYKTIQGKTQGTSYTITYEDWQRRILQSKIEHLFHKFDMSLSTYEPNSIISRINKNEEDVKIDKYFKTIFLKSAEINKISEGAFDITVAPLVNAWGFGSGKKTPTDSSSIKNILKFVGMDKIWIKDGEVAKICPEVQLDVNAIAQGYSVDVVAEYLEQKGIKNYMVEIGGEIKTKGLNRKGEIWKIGVDRPEDNNFQAGKSIQAILSLNNKALSTSGNYRKFYIKDGVKYAHTINPKTGYPILNNVLSATVMANDCMTADAFATAFMVLGLEKSIKLVSTQNYLDVYLIYSDEKGNYKSFMTPGMKKAILQEAP